jgi:hypothetical protein
MAVNKDQLVPWARRHDVRIGAVVAVLAAIAFIVLLLVSCGGKSGSGTTTTTASVQPIAPTAASVDRIRSLSVDVGRPIYWAGPRAGDTYELQRTSNDRIFVRYLPSGVPVGTPRAGYTLVGTYVLNDAYGALKSLAKQSGEKSFDAPKNGIAVYSTSRPTNVYLAYPNSDEQIEVYDPSPDQARELVSSGQIVPVS